jgi:hypothetical protein
VIAGQHDEELRARGAQDVEVLIDRIGGAAIPGRLVEPLLGRQQIRQFDSAKSMIRNLPPKNTAGLARRSVSCFSRLPRPPASTSAIVRRVNLC